MAQASAAARARGRVLDPALMVTFPSFLPSSELRSNIERPQDTNLVLTISAQEEEEAPKEAPAARAQPPPPGQLQFSCPSSTLEHI